MRVRSGHSLQSDGSWRPWYTLHRDTCRFAEGGDSPAAYIDMWGRAHWDAMLHDGRIKTCGMCRPENV